MDFSSYYTASSLRPKCLYSVIQLAWARPSPLKILPITPCTTYLIYRLQPNLKCHELKLAQPDHYKKIFITQPIFISRFNFFISLFLHSLWSQIKSKSGQTSEDKPQKSSMRCITTRLNPDQSLASQYLLALCNVRADEVAAGALMKSSLLISTDLCKCVSRIYLVGIIHQILVPTRMSLESVLQL